MVKRKVAVVGSAGSVQTAAAGSCLASEHHKHLGLAEAPDGSIYSTYFERSESGGGPAGAVTRVELSRGESVVADGFGKLVGIVVVGEALYVADQSAGVIYSAPLAALPAHAGGWSTFARLPVPDQLCAGPDGSLFSAQFKVARGSADALAVRQIHADGSVTPFVAAPEVTKPSGVAYDPEGHRLFVADSGDAAHNGVHIFPVR